MIIIKEFSKLIIITIFIISILFIISVFVLMFITGDTTPLIYLIPSFFAEVSLSLTWYYKKAEKENIIKLKTTYIKEIEKIKSRYNLTDKNIKEYLNNTDEFNSADFNTDIYYNNDTI